MGKVSSRLTIDNFSLYLLRLYVHLFRFIMTFLPYMKRMELYKKKRKRIYNISMLYYYYRRRAANEWVKKERKTSKPLCCCWIHIGFITAVWVSIYKPESFFFPPSFFLLMRTRLLDENGRLYTTTTMVLIRLIHSQRAHAAQTFAIIYAVVIFSQYI